jgi:hypothetical protein
MGYHPLSITHTVNQRVPSNLLKQGIKNCFKISAVTRSLTKIKIFSLSLELTQDSCSIDLTASAQWAYGTILFVQAPIARAVISKIHPIEFHM